MSRAEERRTARGKDIPDHLKPLKLMGSDVVLAVGVHGEADEEGNRNYRTWVRGPATNHTNAEMVQLLSLIATTFVFGNAQAGAISLQQSIDEIKKVFGQSLDNWVHRQVGRGLHNQNLTTVPMEREAEGGG